MVVVVLAVSDAAKQKCGKKEMEKTITAIVKWFFMFELLFTFFDLFWAPVKVWLTAADRSILKWQNK